MEMRSMSCENGEITFEIFKNKQRGRGGVRSHIYFFVFFFFLQTNIKIVEDSTLTTPILAYEISGDVLDVVRVNGSEITFEINPKKDGVSGTTGIGTSPSPSHFSYFPFIFPLHLSTPPHSPSYCPLLPSPPPSTSPPYLPSAFSSSVPLVLPPPPYLLFFI